MRALSWRVALPRYQQLGGRSVLTLNKLTQSCPGFTASVGYRLFAQADVPAPDVRYARLHVNGVYLRYMIEFERPGEDMYRRYHREQAEKYGTPTEKVGHLFKSVGCVCDEGPFGWGDWRQLSSHCGWSVRRSICLHLRSQDARLGRTGAGPSADGGSHVGESVGQRRDS